MTSPRPFDRHWYAEQIRYADRLRAEGQAPHLQAALAVLTQVIDLVRQTQAHLARPWHERLLSAADLRLLRPRRRRDLAAYLALALPNFESLRDQLTDDLAAIAENSVAEHGAAEADAPEIGPIGPRSRPSPFAARVESHLELV